MTNSTTPQCDWPYVNEDNEIYVKQFRLLCRRFCQKRIEIHPFTLIFKDILSLFIILRVIKGIRIFHPYHLSFGNLFSYFISIPAIVRNFGKKWRKPINFPSIVTDRSHLFFFFQGNVFTSFRG